MTESELIASISSTIDHEGDVSFASLAINYPEDFARGDREIVKEGDGFSNIVLWAGLSQTGVDVIRELTKGAYETVPTHFLVYLADGVVPRYPLAKSARHYKEPHWLPCVLIRKDSERAKTLRRPSRRRSSSPAPEPR